jgi:acetyl-CoA carboxylase biotin carboxyl carrier protein
MTLDDIRQILELVKTHELAEFELERDGLKIRIRKANDHVAIAPPVTPLRAPAPLPARSEPHVETAPATTSIDGSGVQLAVITSPIVGTFYRSSEPGSRPFVEVGDHVKKGQVLCIIEAMKLMNEIESETDGEISTIFVENGKPVQFGDRLFAVKVDV